MAVHNLQQSVEQTHIHDDVFNIASGAQLIDLIDQLSRHHSQMRAVCDAISGVDDDAIAGTFFLLSDMSERCNQLTSALLKITTDVTARHSTVTFSMETYDNAQLGITTVRALAVMLTDSETRQIHTEANLDAIACLLIAELNRVENLLEQRV
ncbi:MAG: hypothetical protein R3F53_05320 [Gammaproteobacteria bacterium]